MITEDIMKVLNLPSNNLKVILEIEIELTQDEVKGIDNDYDFWLLVLDNEPFKTEVVSVKLVKDGA